MEYKYCEYNPNYFATNLHLDVSSGKLTWNNAPGQEVLIVQAPFGDKISKREKIEELCAAMVSCELEKDKFTDILPEISVRFITSAEKSRLNGCPLNGEASTYSVLGIMREDNVVKIFEPIDQAMLSPYCDIPLSVKIEVLKITKSEGLLRKREVFTGFYEIIFPENMSTRYSDGDLIYKIGNLNVPLTKETIRQKRIYIKTDIRPEVRSNRKGLRLI